MQVSRLKLKMFVLAGKNFGELRLDEDDGFNFSFKLRFGGFNLQRATKAYIFINNSGNAVEL